MLSQAVVFIEFYNKTICFSICFAVKAKRIQSYPIFGVNECFIESFHLNIFLDLHYVRANHSPYMHFNYC